MNSIRWTKGICWMLPASLVRIAVEKCILSTIKVPTVWNTSSQIIKKNNTTTQKKASGWFSPMLFLFFGWVSMRLELWPTACYDAEEELLRMR